MTEPAAPEVLVIGAGSIGARHVANLVELGAHVTSTDPDDDRAAATGADRRVPFDLDHLDGYDGIVVASPTRFHLDQALAAVATGAAVMVEKPLAERADHVDDLVAAGGDRLMVGYNLRLHEPVEQVVRLVHSGQLGQVVAARLWFGSWLPDWRPGTDYRTSYSARAELGGGVLNDAIHELDLALWLFGADLRPVAAVVGRFGPLAIDVEDTVSALLVTASGTPVGVELDYLSRRYRRGIEVVGTEATARLDWSRAVIEVETADQVAVTEATTSVEVSYRREAQAFLDLVRGAAPPVDGATGAASLRLAEAIRARVRMTTVAVVQARMGSTRLPGKVLMELAGRPMLSLMLERLAGSVGREVDELVVATSDQPGDDRVVEVARAAGAAVVRGSEADVLDRFAGVLAEHPADTIVRLTADCPLIDPALVVDALDLHRRSGASYTSNTLVRTFPDGLDVEVVRAEVLLTAAAEATDPVEREHVTPFVYRRPARFPLRALRVREHLGDERWTIDNESDLADLHEVVGRLDDPVRSSWREILAVTGRRSGPAAGQLWLRPYEPDDGTSPGGVAMAAIDTPPDDPSTRTWVAEVDGSPVGWLRVEVDDGRGRLSGQVHPEHRDEAHELLQRALAADRQVVRLVETV